MENIVISVLTTAYNRANTIHRVFESLEKSSYRCFELIIVDDGSTDNIVEVVNKYKKIVKYPVTFYRKENGGKHTAVNILYKLAKGKYVFQLDSDDELMPNAMEKALKIWREIPVSERDNYWCVCGRYIDSKRKNINGILFPENINDLNWNKARKIATGIKGDKIALQRLEIIKKYPFPENEFVKFITEDIIWRKIDSNYKQHYTNNIFGVCYVNGTDRLTNSQKNIQTVKNNYFNNLYKINNFRELNIGLLNYISIQIRFWLNSKLLDNDTARKIGTLKFYHKIISILLSPVGYLLLSRFRKQYDIRG